VFAEFNNFIKLPEFNTKLLFNVVIPETAKVEILVVAPFTVKVEYIENMKM
jgi:hypothetical protein